MQHISSKPNELTQHKCVPCEGGIDPMTVQEEDNYRSAVANWELNREGMHKLTREMTFKNFKEVLAFVNQVGALAEVEGHHPNLYMHDYKKLRIELLTFAIGGLSMNDFILAAKIDELTSTH